MTEQLITISTCVLLLINLLFVGSGIIILPTELLTILQWILVSTNIILLCIGVSLIHRKKPKHFTHGQVTTFQCIFFILYALTIALLCMLILAHPIQFMIVMPFEFFMLAFYMGWYFFLARHVLPVLSSRPV